MSGIIKPISKEQQISDLQCDRDAFKRALEDIIRVQKNPKKLKESIQSAIKILNPDKNEEDNCSWNGSIVFWWRNKRK